MNDHSAIGVAIGIVRNHSGRVLITRRKSDAVLGDLWEFPGGKLEPGETAEACVVRELREEVDLHVEVIGSFTTLSHHYDHGQVHLIPRLCRVVSGEARAVEVAALAWVKPDDFDRYGFPDANAPLLEAVRSIAPCLTRH